MQSEEMKKRGSFRFSKNNPRLLGIKGILPVLNNPESEGRDTQAIQHYLGQRNIGHTVRYTELSPERFKDFWED